MSIANTEDVNYAAENASRIACQMVELSLIEVAREIGNRWNPVLTSNDLASALESVADRISAKLKESSEKPQS